jgi:hypothetical protein
MNPIRSEPPTSDTKCDVYGGTRHEMMVSSSDDWILLAVRLQPLLITIHHSTIVIPHILQSAHSDPQSISSSLHFTCPSYNAHKEFTNCTACTTAHVSLPITHQVFAGLLLPSGDLPPPLAPSSNCIPWLFRSDDSSNTEILRATLH